MTLDLSRDARPFVVVHRRRKRDEPRVYGPFDRIGAQLKQRQLAEADAHEAKIALLEDPDALDPEQLVITVTRSGLHSPRNVRVIHRPTGLSADATGMSELQAKDEALAELARRVARNRAPAEP